MNFRSMSVDQFLGLRKVIRPRCRLLNDLLLSDSGEGVQEMLNLAIYWVSVALSSSSTNGNMKTNTTTPPLNYLGRLY
jgi:hypothetical protein